MQKILFLLLMLNCSCMQHNTNAQKNEANEVKKFDRNPKNLRLKYISGIRAILQDSKGNYWFGSDQEGVCQFDGNKFTYFTTENGLSGNQIRAIKEDQTGKIWFETNHGICNFDGKNITNFTNQNNLLYPPKNQNIKLNINDLWFYACDKMAIFQYDGKQLNQVDFPTSDKKNWSNDVNAFSKGKDNLIWIASFTAVYGFDGKNFKIIDDKFLGNNNTTGFLHIRCILEDSKGRLWIGNNGIGALVSEGNDFINFSEKMGLVALNSSRGGAPSPPNTMEHIFAISEDKQGNIWFGDRDNGAWKYDGYSIKNYIIDKTLFSQHIWSIYQDKNGELLFAMASGGVYRFVNEGFERVF